MGEEGELNLVGVIEGVIEGVPDIANAVVIKGEIEIAGMTETTCVVEADVL